MFHMNDSGFCVQPYPELAGSDVLEIQLDLSNVQSHGCSLSLFFPDRVHIITWNVGSATPPDDITALLGLNVGDGNTDMYIIG